MVCPCRKRTVNAFEKFGSNLALVSVTEEFPDCYEDECPYYNAYLSSKCEVLNKEIVEK